MRTKQIATLVTAACVLSVGPSVVPRAVASLPPSESATAQAPALADDLPTVRQVARVYPAYKGGSRSFLRNRIISDRTADCLYYVNGPGAVRGTLAVYDDRRGDSPYFYGHVSPVTGIYEFRNIDLATRAFARVQATIRRCEGTNSEGRTSVTLDEVAVPPMGEQTVAYRERLDGYRVNPNDSDFTLRIWARVGRRLVTTSAQRDPGAPAKQPLVKLARIAISKAGAGA